MKKSKDINVLYSFSGDLQQTKSYLKVVSFFFFPFEVFISVALLFVLYNKM